MPALCDSGHSPDDVHDKITEAESVVAGYVALGWTNAEIAAEVALGVGTVKTHLSRLYSKTRTRNRTELACWVRDNWDSCVGRGRPLPGRDGLRR